MERKEAKARIEELKRVIHYHRYLYHVFDREEISQDALDSLKHELKKLEEAYPQYVTLDSPTHRVGGRPLEKFTKVQHRVKQWSLEDAFSEDEIREWEARMTRIVPDTSFDYIGELKIDGLHVLLTYEKGVFAAGATRGDGEVGEDVTQNLRTIEAIPLVLTKPLDCVVGGEVFMRKSVFAKLNRERAKAGEALLANPRNAAAGAIRQLDPRIAAARRLDCFAYDIEWMSETLPWTQQGELEMLPSLGFKVNSHWKRFDDINAVIAFWESWEKKRDSEDYWVDGVVIKVSQRPVQERLGYTGKAPRFIIAAKFSGKESTTTVTRVIPSIGRTGKITPVALLIPVQLQGTTVARASLHNYDEVARLDVREGDTVIVSKAGDVIPQVINVVKELRKRGAKVITPPQDCPMCGVRLAKEKDLVDYFCPNPSCSYTRARALVYFFSKQGLNAQGVGEKVIERFLDEGLVRDSVDVFDLRPEDVAPLKGFGSKSAQNIIQAIKDAKAVLLWRFLAALGIEHVGSQTALLLEHWLRKEYGNISNPHDLVSIFAGLSKEQLEAIEGIGPKVSESVLAFASNKRNQNFLNELSKRGLIFLTSSAGGKEHNLRGKTLLLTGSLHGLTRGKAKELIIRQGGRVASGISKKVDYVVIGDNPGSKVDKAKRLGVKIIDEETFLKITNQ